MSMDNHLTVVLVLVGLYFLLTILALASRNDD